MGQYYIPVNVTKRQFIDPHRFGDGLKEIEMLTGVTPKALAVLLFRSNEGGGGDLYSHPYSDAERKGLKALVGSWAGDNIVIVGDYDTAYPHGPGFDGLYREARETFKDISADVLKVLIKEEAIDDAVIVWAHQLHQTRYIGLDGKEQPVDPVKKACAAIYKKEYQRLEKLGRATPPQ